MAYMGRLCPKGVTLFRLRYMKGWGNLSLCYFKGPLVKIIYFEQTHLMAVSFQLLGTTDKNTPFGSLFIV